MMKIKTLILILGIAVVFFSLIPLLRDGFFPVHDNTQIERVFEMKNSLSNGQFPVRWAENLGYGYGYPIFNFYAPLPYYIGGFLNLILNDSLISTKIVFAVGIALSFIFMYLFASSLTNRAAGFVAATIYLYFPYHAANIYVRGAVGEFFAYAFLPLVFWGIHSIYKDLSLKKTKGIFLKSALTAVAIALVVLSHNLSAFMLSIVLLPYTLLLLLFVKEKASFVKSLSLILGFSFLLSAFYILPAVFESKYTNVESQVGGGAYYADHFVCPEQLWESAWGFGGSAPGCIDGLSFKLGKINFLLVLASAFALIYFFTKKKKSHTGIIFVFILALSIFLLLPYSRFLWDAVPYMDYLQYPWRFLNFAGLFATIVIALALYKIKNKKVLLLSSSIIIISTLYFNAKLFVPAEYNTLRNSHYEDIEHIRWETSKISDEYMPKKFVIGISESRIAEKFEIVDGEGEVIGSNSKTGRHTAEVFLNTNSTIRANIAYFPAWQLKVNGLEAGYKIGDDGLYIDLSEGSHNVDFNFRQTPIQLLGNILTVIGIISVLAVIIVKRRKAYG